MIDLRGRFPLRILLRTGGYRFPALLFRRVVAISLSLRRGIAVRLFFRCRTQPVGFIPFERVENAIQGATNAGCEADDRDFGPGSPLSGFDQIPHFFFGHHF